LLLLNNVGHTVLCAVDAETGLTIARTSRPDLILMDIQLPGMDGLAATRLLKKDPLTASIPVIALTALAMKEDQEKTRAAGCDAYMAKPIRYKDLYAAIDGLLVVFPTSPLDTNPFSIIEEEEEAPPFYREAEVFVPPSRQESLLADRLILVAEDNETNQKLVKRQLGLLGFACDMATNGKAAFDLWKAGRYSLLLTDIQMPEMDGHELAIAIRREEDASQLRRIPIIALTANATRGGADQCLMNGMDGYLTKPVYMTELGAALAKWLPGPAPLTAPSPASPTSTAASSVPVDVRVLEEIIGSNPAVVLDMLSDFTVSLSQIATVMQSDFAAQDFPGMRNQSHKLVSSCRAVGARDLSQYCVAIEAAAKTEDAKVLPDLVAGFISEVDKVSSYLNSLQLKCHALLGQGTQSPPFLVSGVQL
jgi:CheY-like chemotaxis protein/HPt (histidine-containing phosphotransfer) domain-containing protein